MKRLLFLFTILIISSTKIAAATEELPRFRVTTESRNPVLGQDYNGGTHRYNPRYLNPRGYSVYVNALPGEEIIHVIPDPEPPQGGGRPEPIETLQLKVPLDTEAVDFSIRQVDGQFSKSRSTGVGALQRTRRGSAGMPPPSMDIWGWSVVVPSEGIYDISVTLRNGDGGGPQRTHRITVQDFLVVSIGDSSASGQGNPDVPGTPRGFEVDFDWWDIIPPIGLYTVSKAAAKKMWNYMKQNLTTLARLRNWKLDMDPDPIWLEKNAYRSLLSGPALAARRLQLSSPGRVITFLSFARTGSEIIDGLIGPRTTDVVSVPEEFQTLCIDILIAFDDDIRSTGTGRPFARTQFCRALMRVLITNGDANPRQLCFRVPVSGPLKDIGSEEICEGVVRDMIEALQENASLLPDAPYSADAWIGNIGQIEEAKNTLGNRRIDALLINIGVNDVGVSSTLTDLVAEDLGLARNDASERRRIRRRADKNLSELPAAFDKLEGALKTLNIRHVYLIEYPTGLFDIPPALQDLPDLFGFDGGGCGIFKSFLDLDLTKADADEIKEIAVELNAILKSEAKKRGWFFVSGIAERFSGHGYCTPDDYRYYVQAEESMVLQGDTEGTIHPNARGHRIYAEQIAAMVEKNTIMVKECASPTEFLCYLFVNDQQPVALGRFVLQQLEVSSRFRQTGF